MQRLSKIWGRIGASRQVLLMEPFSSSSSSVFLGPSSSPPRHDRQHSSSGTIAAASSFSGSGAYRPTPLAPFPMKPGTPIPGLDLYKDQDGPVALERSAYPDWVGDLAKPLPTLAELRRMPEEEATDRDIMRYLKLTRKKEIKRKNEESKGVKRDK